MSPMPAPGDVSPGFMTEPGRCCADGLRPGPREYAQPGNARLDGQLVQLQQRQMVAGEGLPCHLGGLTGAAGVWPAERRMVRCRDQRPLLNGTH